MPLTEDENDLERHGVAVMLAGIVLLVGSFYGLTFFDGVIAAVLVYGAWILFGVDPE